MSKKYLDYNGLKTYTNCVKELVDTKLDKEGGSITGDLTVSGDLTVKGTEHITSVVNLNVKDAMIYSNADGAPLAELAGLGIKTDADNVYGIAYDKDADAVKLGLGKADENGKFTFNSGEGEPVATRSDSNNLTDGNLLKWDAKNNKLVDSGKKTSDIDKKYDSDNLTAGDGITFTSDGKKTTIKSNKSNLVNGEGDYSLRQASYPSAQNETSGYNSIAMGENNKAYGPYTIAFGLNNICYNTLATAIGKNNSVNSKYCFAIGNKLYIPAGLLSEDGTLVVVGAYNVRNSVEELKNKVFIVSNGTSNADRKNAFEVLYDGRAKVQSAPTEDDDVVRLKELDAVKAKTMTLTVPISITTDYDFSETQSNFNVHTVSFTTDVDNVTYRITFRTNLPTATTFTNVGAIYDNFEEVCRYIETCVVTYGNDSEFSIKHCYKIAKSTVTSGKFLSNAVAFTFEV